MVIIHEIAHLIDHKLKIMKQYLENWPLKKDRLILNSNSRTDRIEELAEIVSVYITNPYLLRLISKERFAFLKSLFKSPAPYSQVFFGKSYERWSMKTKRNFKRRFGIFIDRKGNIVYKE